MGVNLLPLVRRFQISTRNFSNTNCAVIEGCVQPGNRKLLRFDFISWNAGNRDLRVGDPNDNLQWYEYSPCHGHYHLKDFNEYRIYDRNRIVRTGNKQAFCLIDIERISRNRTRQFTNCNNNQGVTAGWGDLYNRGLDCQWIDITGLRNGSYVLEAQTNAHGLLSEDRYGDNYTWAGIRIYGNTVTEIEPPFYPEDSIPFNPSRIRARRINRRWKVVDGNHWILDFNRSASNARRAARIIRHYRLNRICFVGRPSKDRKQLMMYFKRGNNVPTGRFPGEDAIPFNNDNVQARYVRNRWKVIDGSNWLLDFGYSEANAKKAVWIIKNYGFRYMCFVGRPNPPMMYFRR